MNIYSMVKSWFSKTVVPAWPVPQQDGWIPKSERITHVRSGKDAFIVRCDCGALYHLIARSSEGQIISITGTRLDTTEHYKQFIDLTERKAAQVTHDFQSEAC